MAFEGLPPERKEVLEILAGGSDGPQEKAIKEIKKYLAFIVGARNDEIINTREAKLLQKELQDAIDGAVLEFKQDLYF